jgi:hypothetical protein
MIKKATLFFVLSILVTFSAKAQMFDLSNNQRISMGINLGAAGYHLGSQGLNTTYNGFAYGANVSVMGFYIDFMRQPPEHKYTKEVGRDWNDHSAFTINVGYQIPITSYLFVAPLIGYSNESYGITKGNKFEIGDRELIHDYDVIERFNHFNYGLHIMARALETVEIGCVVSSHALYGTLSYSFGKK